MTPTEDYLDRVNITVNSSPIHIASALLIVAALPGHCYGAEPAAQPTLAGEWAGKWTDSREGYNNSGGTFTCSAADKDEGSWSATFTVGGARTFKVILRGRRQDGQLLFNGAYDLGGGHGVYTLKGSVTLDTFSGEYDGPDEKGSFKLTRAGPRH